MSENSTITDLLNQINAVIINPLILLLFAIAIAMFVWGVVEFLSSEGEGERREQGKRNLLFGLIGLFIMVAVYGIIQLIGGTFGIPVADLYIFS